MIDLYHICRELNKLKEEYPEIIPVLNTENGKLFNVGFIEPITNTPTVTTFITDELIKIKDPEIQIISRIEEMKNIVRGYYGN